MDIDTAKAVTEHLDAAATALKAAHDKRPCEAIGFIYNDTVVEHAYYKGYIWGHEHGAGEYAGLVKTLRCQRDEAEAREKAAHAKHRAYKAVVDALINDYSIEFTVKHLRGSGRLPDDAGDRLADALEALPAALDAVGCDNEADA